MIARIAALRQQRAGALVISPDSLFISQSTQLAALAFRDMVPAIAQREFADAGGLASYSTNHVEMYRLVGGYVGQILKGEKPANLPVHQPSKFVNLKTARALGLTLPPTLLGRADEVIE